MKNYDLSQYMLRKDNVLMFPLTKEELEVLRGDEGKFSRVINLPYYAKIQEKEELDTIINGVDMDDDYWFMKSQWAIVDVKVKAIVGYLRLEVQDIWNIIVLQVSEDVCKGIEREDALGLFYRFLAGNGYPNICVRHIDRRQE